MVNNVYQIVTDRIIAELEKGSIPWQKPWSGVRSGAFNRISKKPYSILNQMLLKHEGEYATFKQWSELGGYIRKGEKSEIVVFWNMKKYEEEDENGEKIEKVVPILRYYNVFHISQVDGVEPLKEKLHEVEPIEEADRIITEYISDTGRTDTSRTEQPTAQSGNTPSNRKREAQQHRERQRHTAVKAIMSGIATTRSATGSAPQA